MVIEWVVFDWGGVLIEDPSPGITAYLEEKLAKKKSEVTFSNKAFLDFQKGEIGEGEFWAELGFEDVLEENGGVSLWREAFESIYQERTFVFDWIKTLRRNGLKTAVLSNTEAPSVRMFKDHGYACFDKLYFSCEIGMIKPHEEIFQYLIKELNTSPESILFLDDKLENIEAAEALGIQTHLMADQKSFEARVNELGLS